MQASISDARVSREFCSAVLNEAFRNGSEKLRNGLRIVRGDILGKTHGSLTIRPWSLFLVGLEEEPVEVLTSSDLEELLSRKMI